MLRKPWLNELKIRPNLLSRVIVLRYKHAEKKTQTHGLPTSVYPLSCRQLIKSSYLWQLLSQGIDRRHLPETATVYHIKQDTGQD